MNRLLALAAVLAAGALAAAVATPALAHTGVSAAHDLTHALASGFWHPVSGLDHVLAMLAVGLYAARLGGRSLWVLPAAFVATMAAGGMLGYAGVVLPMVEPGIAISVIAMGMLIALGVQLPLPAAVALVALFALVHGHAHGSEGAGLAAFLPYAAGFVAATTLLHVAGIAAGLGLDRLGTPSAAVIHRLAGAAGAVAGIALLIG